jgi:hypothetical protein
MQKERSSKGAKIVSRQGVCSWKEKEVEGERVR